MHSLSTPLRRHLPEALEPLVELALNLCWTWMHKTDKLWQALDSVVWSRTQNPWSVLHTVSQERLEELSKSRRYTGELRHLLNAYRENLQQQGWCAQTYPSPTLNPVAYLSREFGSGEALPLYAGGLGILAGDYLKTAPGMVEEAQAVLDPQVLTLGFARRFAAYKRPNLLLQDADRLKRILTHPERPVQLIVAGKAHPHDEEGKRLVQQLVQFSRQPDVRQRIAFLEDYDIELARHLVQGVDVWVNTPRPELPGDPGGLGGSDARQHGPLNPALQLEPHGT